MDNYPSNSRKLREEPAEDEQSRVKKPVVTGRVVRQKKTPGKRLADMVRGIDVASVFEYIVRDVLVPAFKDTATDAITQGTERLIFGEVRGGYNRARSRSSSSYTSYNRYSSPTPRSSLIPRDDPRRPPERERRAHKFDDIILESRGEAESVLEEMIEILSQYETVCVRDLLELLGETGSWTDQDWGWTDLRDSNVVRVKGGYLLNIPRPEPLK